MASPQLADPPVGINPHKSARYTIKLSDRITDPSQSQSRFKTVKFNHKPKATGNVRTTTIKPASTGDSAPDQFTLCMRDKETADSTKASTYEYAGQRRELKKTYVLLFDKDSQTATLEPLEETYAFNLKRAPWEKEPAKLAQQYQQVIARSEKPGRLDAAADDVDDLFSDGSDSQSVNESVFGGRSSDDEDPEEGNPYDFRRFVQDAEQSEGFVSPVSQSGTPLRITSTTTSAPARSTPLPQTVAERPKTKQALKPAPKPAVKQQAPSRKRKSPEPEKPAAKPKATTSSSTSSSAAATKAQPTPAIRLDRRASTRPTDSTLSTSAPAAAPSSNQSPKSSSRTSREPTPEEEEEDDDDALGGLEIDWGGSDKSASRGRPRRSIALAFEQGVTGDGPVSLRSAADSASPNSRLHTPSMHPTSAKHRDVIELDFNGGGDSDEDDEDDDVFHEQHPRGPRDDELDEEDDEEDVADAQQQQEQQEDDDGYAEDDEDADNDVDPLTLGSPAADTLQQQQQHHQQQVELGVDDDAVGATYEDDEDDGGDDLEDDFEAEMAQALASAAEEDVVAPEDSEEESEEE